MSTRPWLFVLAVLIAAPVADAQTASRPTRILIVQGHNPSAPGVVAFLEQLKGLVREGITAEVSFYEEFLDLYRFDDSVRSQQLARNFSEKYEKFRPDAIVALGSMAVRFTTERLNELFTGVPVVYGLAFEPIVDFDALPPNVSGREQPLPFRATLALARALQPQAERVVLVAGAAPRDSVIGSAAIRQMTPLLKDLDLAVLQNWTYKTLLDSLRRIPPRTILILSSITRDQSGYEFNTGEIIPSLARAAAVPLYGIARNWVGDGIVGGAVMDFSEDGLRTGQMLVRVLQRAPGEPMPSREVAGTPLVVDWRQLERWGLSQRSVPPDTEVLFRTPTAWERHWLTILGVLALVAAQSALIWLLLVERRRRIGAQRAIEEQSAYEQMIAGLSTDAARVAPDRVPRALDDALARLGMFSGARAAVLHLNGDPRRPPTRVLWTANGNRSGSDSSSTNADFAASNGSRLEVVLVAEDTRYGTLELYPPDGKQWPKGIVTRIEAAADLLAAALARERAALALEQAKGQIAHMARVATMGELAAAVAHELRQPLTAIRANAEAGTLLLAQAKPELAEAREIFADIIRDDSRAAQVIEHIWMLVRKEEPNRTSVDLNAVCLHIAQLLEQDIRLRGASLELVLAPELPPVHGDPVQLHQVLINLVLNALDATASSSWGHHVIVGTTASHGRVQVFVCDNGPGIRPGVLEQIFEPFFSTKSSGLGMGLAIVRTIVERHRGTVRAENVASGGAIFRVAFPQHDPKPQRTEKLVPV